MRYKVAIRFGIEGDLRFISHRDTMRLFERALSRAALPIRFSEGFNPRPKLSLPLPRPVGIASQCDLLVVELSEAFEPGAVLARLSAQMPSGITLFEAWFVGGARAIQVDRVEYVLDLPEQRTATVAAALRRLMAAKTWPVERGSANRSGIKTIDLRAYLVGASVEQSGLRWMTRVTVGGSSRPAEVLTAVGLDSQEWHHRVRRTAIHLAPGGTGKTAVRPDRCSKA